MSLICAYTFHHQISIEIVSFDLTYTIHCKCSVLALSIVPTTHVKWSVMGHFSARFIGCRYFQAKMWKLSYKLIIVSQKTFWLNARLSRDTRDWQKAGKQTDENVSLLQRILIPKWNIISITNNKQLMTLLVSVKLNWWIEVAETRNYDWIAIA